MITIQTFISVMLIYTLFVISALWWIDIKNDERGLDLFIDVKELNHLILDMAEKIDELRKEINKLKRNHEQGI